MTDDGASDSPTGTSLLLARADVRAVDACVVAVRPEYAVQRQVSKFNGRKDSSKTSDEPRNSLGCARAACRILLADGEHPRLVQLLRPSVFSDRGASVK